MSEPTVGMPVTDGKDQFCCELGCSINLIHNLIPVSIDTSRLGKINQGPNMTGSLRVLEVDLADFHLDDPSSKVWPDFAPRVDGVIVCYDSSSLSSFAHVERLVCTIRLLCFPNNVLTKVLRWLQ
jgi:GTPase SAR1 family protein